MNLGKHGILSPQVITPKILFDELRNFRGGNELPVTPENNNIHIYYKIMELQVFSVNNISIFAVKIPLVNKINYIIYNLIPLPIQHFNTSVYSYIQPKKPFLLLSQSKTYFTLLQDLSSCSQYQKQEYPCKDIHTTKRTDQISCETQLLASHLHS